MNKKIFGKVFVIIAFIALVIVLYSYVKDFEVKKYISENNTVELIDVDSYDVFLTGETHTMSKSEELKKSIFTYLNKNANVKNIIEEVGFSSGVLLNEYIQTGNEEYLDYFMKQLYGTMAYTKEKYEFYKWLYEYNSQLDNDDKITVYGIDIDHQNATAIKGISTLIDENKSVPETIEKAIYYTKKCMPNAKDYLKTAYENNRKECKEFFGENFIVFENCIKNLYPTETGSDMRDKVMMNNFSFIYSLNKGGKFFAQLGSEHIYQDYLDSDYASNEEVRFGMLLNDENSPVKDKVYSLLYVYKNEDEYSPSKSSFDYSLIKNYKEDTFVELSQKNSPFYKHEYFFKGRNNGRVTGDYIQGLMVLINSKKTTPL